MMRRVICSGLSRPSRWAARESRRCWKGQAPSEALAEEAATLAVAPRSRSPAINSRWKW